MNRTKFVGLTAGATAAGPVLAAAASAQLIPIPENDPDISVSRVTLDRPGIALPAYVAQPHNTAPNTPGVVLVAHIWGVDEQMRDTARRFAKAGFAAIVPDIFARSHPPSGDGTSDYKIFVPFAQALERDEVDGDLRGGARWLTAAHPKSKVGITGFCMGGGVALRQAVDSAAIFSADVVWYGRVADIDPANVHVPVLGLYGEQDTGILPADVRAFYSKLTVPHDLTIYPQAGHAFFDHTRSSWVQSASEDAWQKAIAFFTKYLTA